MPQDIVTKTQTAVQASYDIGRQPTYHTQAETAQTNAAVPQVAEDEKINKTVQEELAAQQAEQAKQAEQQAKTSEPVTREQMEKLAENLQEFMSSLNKSLEFSVDEDSGKDVITVSDRESGDVIRQYPSEEVLKLMSRLADSVGLLVQTEA